MYNHTNSVNKSVHHHIRALRHIRSSIYEDIAKMVACVLIGSRIDYANSVLYGTTNKNIPKIQKAENFCAHVLTNSLQPSSYTLLQQLHWLPTEYCINFTIADITFHTLHSFQPAYLYSALHAHRSTCSLRWSNNNLLSVPFLRTSFGTCSFGVAAPKIWNSLSPAFQMCTSPNTCHNHLKTHYFQ